MMIASAILAALSLALSTNGTSVVVSAVGRERVSVGTVGAEIKRAKGDLWGLQFTPTNVVCSGEGRWTLSFRSKNAAEAKEAALSAVAETRGDEIEFRFKLTPLNGGRILCDKLRSIGLRVADGIDFVQPNWPGIWHRDAKGGVPYETCGCRIPGYEADDGILYLAYPQAASWAHDPKSARQFLWTPEPDGAASFAMRLHWFAGGGFAALRPIALADEPVKSIEAKLGLVYINGRAMALDSLWRNGTAASAYWLWEKCRKADAAAAVCEIWYKCSQAH